MPNPISVKCPVCGADPNAACVFLNGKATPRKHSKQKIAVLQSTILNSNSNQQNSTDQADKGP